jgi:hypothetical protein
LFRFFLIALFFIAQVSQAQVNPVKLDSLSRSIEQSVKNNRRIQEDFLKKQDSQRKALRKKYDQKDRGNEYKLDEAGDEGTDARKIVFMAAFLILIMIFILIMIKFRRNKKTS